MTGLPSAWRSRDSRMNCGRNRTGPPFPGCVAKTPSAPSTGFSVSPVFRTLYTRYQTSLRSVLPEAVGTSTSIIRSGLKENSRQKISRRNFTLSAMPTSVSVEARNSGFHCSAGSLRSSMTSCVLTVSLGSKLGAMVVKTPGASCRPAGGAADTWLAVPQAMTTIASSKQTTKLFANRCMDFPLKRNDEKHEKPRALKFQYRYGVGQRQQNAVFPLINRCGAPASQSGRCDR